MIGIPSPEEHWQRLIQVLFEQRRDPQALSAALAADPLLDLPESVSQWLGRLFLLYGVPFEYMIPDPGMLPQESLRFFQVDFNWINRAIDGAATVGLTNSADVAAYLLSFEQIAATSAAAAAAVRDLLRGLDSQTSPAPITQMAGFLFRSIVVQNFPGLEIRAYADTARTQELRILRLERLTPAILLCLFDGTPALLEILQPPEGLHFGSHQEPDGQTLWVYLRGLGYGSFPAGVQLPNKSKQTLVRRSGQASSGVLDIAACAAALRSALVEQGAFPPDQPFTAAEFAIQLTAAAGLQTFLQPE